jgi:hypothetical protein
VAGGGRKAGGGGRAGSEERGVKDSPTSLCLAPSTLCGGEAGRRG